MATFFKSSRLWAVEYRYEGRTRRWLKALPEAVDARLATMDELRALYGERAKLVEVRPATAQEEAQWRRGEEPRNAFCPSGRLPVTPVNPPEGED